MPYPCTRPVTWVAFAIDDGVMKVKGYCRTHKPRRIPMATELPPRLVKEVNGSRSRKARIRKMEDSMFIRVVPSSGWRMHLVLREQVKILPTQQWVEDVTGACGKVIKRGYIPTPQEEREDYDQCAKCNEAKVVVQDETHDEDLKA